MPFTKIKSGKNKGKYKSPTGKVFSAAQVKLYYINNKTFPKSKSKKPKK